MYWIWIKKTVKFVKKFSWMWILINFYEKFFLKNIFNHLCTCQKEKAKILILKLCMILYGHFSIDQSDLGY